MSHLHRGLRYFIQALIPGAFIPLSGCIHFSDLEPLTESAPSGSLLITHARVFDGSESQPILPDQDIYIVNGVIEKMGPHPLKVSAERSVDATGKLAMPGMIDFHVHVGGTEAPPWRPTFYPPERTLSAFLAFGVTSVVDLGGIPQQLAKLQQQLDTGEISGPRLVYAGKHVSVSQSHPGPLFDESVAWPLSKVLKKLMIDEVDTNTDFPALIEEHAEAGGSVLKLMVDQVPIGSPSMSPEVAQRVVTAAHALNMPVAAHIGSDDDMNTALSAGVDMIAHPVNRTELKPMTRIRLKESGTPVISTLRVFQNIGLGSEGINPVTTADAAIMDPEIVSAFETRGEISPTMVDYAKTIAKNSDNLFDGCRQMQEAAIPMLVGTDTPLFGAPAGSTMAVELSLLVEKCGFSPRRALHMATGAAGTILGPWLNQPGLGKLKETAPADILLIDGDPLENIHAIENVSAVISRGQFIKRKPH
ncbi:MAG: amidohydrolase family protein [Hahellaceae bacterium]|nr:amidohydrolase family protein [Hahellaceae bacterium]